MNRIAVWIANGALVVLCCLLLAATVQQFIAKAAVPDPSLIAVAETRAPATEKLQRNPQLIVEASPFSRVIPGTDPNAMDNLPTTKLSLRLLGTLATASTDTSFAAIEETDTRQSHIVKIKDQIKGTATIVAIERKRIVLDNAGQREELALEEVTTAGTQNSAQARGTAQRGAVRGSPRGANAFTNSNSSAIQNRPTPAASTPSATPANPNQLDPAALLRQAKILPKFDDGNMVGMQINSIQGNSLFSKIGLQNGDVVKEFNGTAVTDTKRGLDMLRDFTTAPQFNLVVQDAEGNARTIHYEIREGDR